MNTLLHLDNVSRTYPGQPDPVHALDGVTLNVSPGEMVALMGPSGSGKSTALSIAGLLLRPTQGDVYLTGKAAPADETTRARLRNASLGFVYQDYSVIEDMSGIDNVAVPLEYARPRIARRGRQTRSQQALETVGLDHSTARRRASTMSGGQRQRVSIARALVNDPQLVLADEPTAALDSSAVDIVMTLLARCRSQGKGVLIATHDERVATRCDRIVTMVDGRLA